MIEVRQVKSKKEFKKFVKFPTELYKNNPYYVPPIELDEYNLTNPKKNASFDDCDAVYFLAYKDGKVVGRVAGIICKLYNEKNNSKRARFSRFDLIDDEKVAKALLTAVEDWAKAMGMEDIHGPLGFNDLEREGLLTYGFNTIGTFQGSWNADYYEKHIINNGYEPDARWVEWRISMPEKLDDKVERMAGVIERRYGFHEKTFKNTKEIINKYGKEIFEVLDEAFAPLYGTMPFNDKLVKQTIDLFKLIIDKDYVSIVFDKEDRVAGFGVAYPSLARAMQKAKGRFLPFGIFHMLHDIRHPKYLELALIGVKPKYQQMGVTAIIIKNMLERIMKNNIIYADTGCQLEDNKAVINALDMLPRELVRKKVCFLKKLQ
ncbi:MAG: GNAT family N-acetyltransferase [Clostridia bacterium]|nr:GNAT family N-acetyltransferase [Clostridia bacterium]